jgi:F0F1-type ATP synthase assembly protein I
MMNINKTSELLNTLLSQTDKKSEKKVYNCFIRTLSSLNNRDLTEDQSQLIQEKLSSLNLNTVPENRKKIYKQKLSEFKAFLKNEFSFTSAKYYTETWMVYGMIFGTGIGISIGTAIGVGLGTSIGLSIGTVVGMVLGMIYGTRKDAETKRQGRVL